MKAKIIFASICILIIAGMSAYVFTKQEPVDTSTAIIELNNKEKENAIKLAAKYKIESEKLQSEFEKSQAEKAPLKAEIARLKARIAPAGPSQVSPGDDSPTADTLAPPSGAVLVRDEIILAQDELIVSLENDVSLLQAQNKIIKLENNQLQIALSESIKNENIYRIQKEAQIAAIKSSRWRGRTEGFTAAAVLDIALRLAKVF